MMGAVFSEMGEDGALIMVAGIFCIAINPVTAHKKKEASDE